MNIFFDYSISCLLKRTFLFFVFAFLLIGNNNVFAQNLDQQIGVDKVIAPNIIVHSIETSQEKYSLGAEINGKFKILNLDFDRANKIGYEITLFDANQEQILKKDKYLQYDLDFAGEEEKEINFQFKLPNNLPAQIVLEVRAFMMGGYPLGWEKKHIEIVGGITENYFKVVDSFIDINGRKYGIQEGPTVKDTQNALLKLTFENNQFYQNLNYDLAISKMNSQTIINVSNNQKIENSNIEIDLPLNLEPGVYEGVLNFKNGDEQISQLDFRYIIYGQIGNISNINISKNSLAKNEMFRLFVYFTGTPARLDIPRGSEVENIDLEQINDEAFLEIEIRNEKGQVLAEKIERVKADANLELDFISKYSAKKVEVSIIAKDLSDNVLDSKVVSFDLGYQEQDSGNNLLILMVVFILLIIALIVGLLTKKYKVSLVIFLILILVLIISFLKIKDLNNISAVFAANSNPPRYSVIERKFYEDIEQWFSGYAKFEYNLEYFNNFVKPVWWQPPNDFTPYLSGIHLRDYVHGNPSLNVVIKDKLKPGQLFSVNGSYLATRCNNWSAYVSWCGKINSPVTQNNAYTRNYNPQYNYFSDTYCTGPFVVHGAGAGTRHDFVALNKNDLALYFKAPTEPGKHEVYIRVNNYPMYVQNYPASWQYFNAYEYGVITFYVGEEEDEFDDNLSNYELKAYCSGQPPFTAKGGTASWIGYGIGGTPPYNYSWDGSASGSDRIVYKTYTENGAYHSTLTITDDDGNTDQTQCLINVVDPDTRYQASLADPISADDLSISCSPRIVKRGEPATINWTSQNGATCQLLFGGEIVSIELSGEHSIGSLNYSAGVRLTCSDYLNNTVYKETTCYTAPVVIEQ